MLSESLAKRKAEVQNGFRPVMFLHGSARGRRRKRLARHLAQDAQSAFNVPDVV